jgi:hypothetical protein
VPCVARLRLSSGSCVHSFDSGKLSIAVWFGARSARMQFTNFPDRRTTRRTRHGQYLFQGKFFGFHQSIVQRFRR